MYGYSAGYVGKVSEVDEIKVDSLYERLKPILDRTDKYQAFPGKAIPYFGPWVPIDFDKRVMIGLHDDGSVGILPSNKWGMPWRKFSVPSNGSMIQVYSLSVSVAPDSSANIEWLLR